MGRKENSARWYEKHREEISLKRRGTRKEEHKASYKKLIETYGREFLNEKTRTWRKENPEKYRKILERSRKNNPERNLLNKARQRAGKLGLDFNIELSDIVIPEFCPYLNIKLDPWAERDFCPSLDRVDNSKGYIKGNVEVISFKANRMKNTATKEELVLFASNVLKRIQML